MCPIFAKTSRRALADFRFRCDSSRTELMSSDATRRIVQRLGFEPFLDALAAQGEQKNRGFEKAKTAVDDLVRKPLRFANRPKVTK